MPDYTILLVDYEPRSIERLRRPLERAGYRIEIAHDGISAIKRFEELKPDLTLIEAMIPKKHGFEVCQELKRTDHGRESAILIITSVYKGRKYRIQATHYYGCDDYLEKPISDERLIEVVHKHIGEPVEPGSFELETEVSESESSDSESKLREDRPEGGGTSDPFLDATEAEILEHLDNVMPTDRGGPSIGEAVAETDAPRPDRLDEPDSSPVASVSGESGTVVDFDLVRPRAPAAASAPRQSVEDPVAGATGAPVGGGAQPALAPERSFEPRAEPEKSSEPVSGSADEVQAIGPKPRPGGTRGRLFLWIALALLVALGALLSAIVFL